MVPLLAGIILLSTAAMLLLYASMHRSLMAQFEDSLRIKAIALGALVHVQPDGHIEFDYTDTDFPEFRRQKQPEYFQIRLLDGGKTIQRSMSLGQANLSRVQGDSQSLQSITLPDGRPGLMLSIVRQARYDEDDAEAMARLSREPSPPPLPMISTTLARDTRALDQTLGRLRIYLLLTVLLLSLGVAVMVPAIVRRGLRPLDAIAEHANSLSLESLDSTFPENHLPEELAPISKRLNELLDRLTASFARETRFSANAAHELRTPIAEIRAVAEVALQWPDLPQAQQALMDVVDVSKRMEVLTQTLLKLAQARAGHIVSQAAPVNVLEIAQHMIELSCPVVAERDLNVTIGTSSGGLAWADPVLCRAMVSNLVSNAVYHSPRSGNIAINETVATNRLVLTIINDCRAFSESDLSFAREPFWTGSTSRSDQSHGLGLALASEYARFLKATLSIDLTEQHDFRTVVAFPLSTQQVSTPLPRDAADIAIR
ncbi:HAMP domain-containing sensor histidine kinase [soil metagenome]